MRYHAIYEGIWRSRHLEGLSFEGKAFFAYLFSNANMRPSGIYRVTDAELAAATDLPLKRVQAYLSDLEKRCRIVRDGAWIFVCGYFERQAKHERLLLGVRSDIEDCDSVPILEAFGQRYSHHSKWSADRLLRVTNPLNGFVRTEQNKNKNRTRTETRTEQDNTSPLAHPSPDGLVTVTQPSDSPIPEKILERIPALSTWPKPEALVALWNSYAERYTLPAVSKLSPKRRQKAIAYLKQFPEFKFWNSAFSSIGYSKFLLGQTPPRAGHASWRCDFDWLLTTGRDATENVVKVHDGRYTDNQQENRA